MRNCGDSTFAKATNAVTAAAEEVSRPSRPRPRRAKRAHTTKTATSWKAVESAARLSGSEPARFWEPCELATVAS